MSSGVYAIKNTVNSRMYVGSSNDMSVRWQCHISRLQQGKHHAHRLQQDWNEYGDHAFVFEVLEVVEPITQLHVVEQKWIDELNPYYNRRMTTGSTRRTIKPKKRVKELSRQHRQEFLAAPSSPPLDPYLTPAEVAEKMRVSRNTVIGMLARGELRATRFGKQWRIGEIDLSEYVNRHYNLPPDDQRH